MTNNLTTKQQALLDAIRAERSAEGVCIRGVWHWRVGRDETQTRGVNALLKTGYLDAIYFAGGRASANLTDKAQPKPVWVETDTETTYDATSRMSRSVRVF